SSPTRSARPTGALPHPVAAQRLGPHLDVVLPADGPAQHRVSDVAGQELLQLLPLLALQGVEHHTDRAAGAGLLGLGADGIGQAHRRASTDRRMAVAAGSPWRRRCWMAAESTEVLT